MKRLVLLLLISCVSCTNYGQLQFVTKLPKKLNEVSGIVPAADGNYWVHEDSGNPDNLYRINLKGELLQKVSIKNAKNRDWEDMARDTMGYLYIGDFGNNRNNRENLVIYKVPEPLPGLEEVRAEKIKFSYPDQKRFPPKPKDFNFDSEAMLYANDSLYVFSKNRSSPFKDHVKVYRIPATPGEYVAELIGTIPTCDDRYWCQVTAADLSPDGKTIVLLGYGNIWMIETDLLNGKLLNGRMESIDHGASSQLESICFTSENGVMLADEAGSGGGRNLYSFTLPTQ